METLPDLLSELRGSKARPAGEDKRSIRGVVAKLRPGRPLEGDLALLDGIADELRGNRCDRLRKLLERPLGLLAETLGLHAETVGLHAGPLALLAETLGLHAETVGLVAQRPLGLLAERPFGVPTGPLGLLAERRRGGLLPPGIALLRLCVVCVHGCEWS